MSETVPGHAELVECPHCGRVPLVMEDDVAGAITGETRHSVSCVNLSCRASQTGWDTPGRAIAAWNRRTPIAAPGAGAVTEAMVERFKKAYGAGLKLVPEEGWKDTTREALEAALRPGEAAGQGEAFRTVSPETQAELDAIDANIRNAAIMAPHIIVGSATPRPAPVAPDIVERATAAYDRVKEWPENRMKPDAIEELGEGFVDLLHLRNHVPKLLEALAALSSELAEAKRKLQYEQDHIAHADAYQKAAMDNLARAEVSEAEVARLKDENKELVAALEPFAKIAEWDIPMDPKHAVGGLIKVGDFRRARSLTAAKGG